MTLICFLDFRTCLVCCFNLSVLNEYNEIVSFTRSFSSWKYHWLTVLSLCSTQNVNIFAKMLLESSGAHCSVFLFTPRCLFQDNFPPQCIIQNWGWLGLLPLRASGPCACAAAQQPPKASTADSPLRLQNFAVKLAAVEILLRERED